LPITRFTSLSVCGYNKTVVPKVGMCKCLLDCPSGTC